VISIHGSQKDARNIEHGFTLGHRNANYLQNKKEENGSGNVKSKSEGSFVSRTIEPECKTKRVPLYPRVPGKAVMTSQDLLASEKAPAIFQSS
jgi:hypothetical protein